MVLSGHCLCGAVRFQTRGLLRDVIYCHCSQCRKGHGAAFASYASVPRDALRILSGESSIRAYASSATVKREFCSECGSTLFWSRSTGEFADWVSIALGTLDTPLPAQEGKVSASMLVLHGAADPFVPREQLPAFEAEMDAAKVNYQFVSIEGAKHGFTNPDADRLSHGEHGGPDIGYNKAADERSWADMQAFFKKVFK